MDAHSRPYWLLIRSPRQHHCDPTLTGYQYDPTSGLYYAGSRYYDPTTGRFISEDPQAANNAYPYAVNDPVNTIDFNGEGPLLDYVDGLLSAFNNGQCVAGIASAIATVAFSATTSALAGAAVDSKATDLAIGLGVGFTIASCATPPPGRRGGNIQANRQLGLDFEDYVFKHVESTPGVERAIQHLGVRTPYGMRYIDILFKFEGKWMAWEVKRGTSEYGEQQMLKDLYMAQVGADVPGLGFMQIPTEVVRGYIW